MDNEVNYEEAKRVYATLIKMLDEKELKYTPDEEALSINISATGEDFPVDMRISVIARNQIVSLLSRIPVTVPNDKLIDIAVATSMANYNLVDGSFDFDIKDGIIVFRMTSSYMGSIIGPDLFEYMLICSFHTIDDYNDKLIMLAKGLITLEQYAQAISK